VALSFAGAQGRDLLGGLALQVGKVLEVISP
jgi:hypothetical protein